jgi:hypothetical protein
MQAIIRYKVKQNQAGNKKYLNPGTCRALNVKHQKKWYVFNLILFLSFRDPTISYISYLAGPAGRLKELKP